MCRGIMDTLRIVACLLCMFSLKHITTAQEMSLIPDYPQYRALNTSLSVICEVTNDDNPRWFGPNGNEIISDSGNPGYDRRLYTEIESDTVATLWFDKIRATDAGEYQCLTEAQNANIKLEILEPIEFVEVPSPQFLTRGQEGFISCEVTGNPTPTIHWKFNHIMHINDNEDYSIVDGGLVVNDVALHDAGTYTCRARVKKTGAVESKDIDVKVYEMPEFFQVPENKSGIEYSSVNLYCNAKGTPEPTLTWLFQGEELTDDEKYFIDPEKTALTIIDLSEFDEGLYTCMASNDAGQVEAVAKLSIHLLPVVGETEDLTVEEGGDIMFTCTAVKGSPVPALKWRRNNVDLYFGATLEDPRMEIYKDGESLILYIKDIKSTDNGAYTCIAENFAGTDAKNFHLFVEHAPHFDSELTQTVVKSWEENPTELSCVAIGNPTPMMSWQHNGMNLDNTTLVDLGLGRVQSLLSVLPSKDDFGDYMCYADNSHGSVNVTITLEETYAPLPPSKIIIDFTTPTSVGFSIKDPEMDGGWPIESCQAILSNSRGEVVKEFETGMDFGFDDLEGSTEYTLKVACRNEVGYSAFTEPVLFETSDYRAPHAPVVISSTKSDKQDLYLLEWMPPNDGGMELISYGIAYTEVIANDVELWETIENIPSYDTQYTINNLKPNTGYQIELWANNKMGKGDVTTVDMTTTAGESVNNPEYHNAGAESILKYSLSLIFICITVAIFKT